MVNRVVGLTCVLLLSSCAIAAQEAKPVERPVRVECHGQLRHGLVAAGGETTGTTIKFDGTTWELQFKDEAGRTFAQSHHKQPVSITGSLRRVSGLAVAERWIIEVERCSERDATKQKEGASVTIHGTLKADAPAVKGTNAMLIEADGISWPLDLSAAPDLSAKANSNASHSVVIQGQLERVATTPPGKLVLKAGKLQVAPEKKK